MDWLVVPYQHESVIFFFPFLSTILLLQIWSHAHSRIVRHDLKYSNARDVPFASIVQVVPARRNEKRAIVVDVYISWPSDDAKKKKVDHVISPGLHATSRSKQRHLVLKRKENECCQIRSIMRRGSLYQKQNIDVS